MHVRDACTVAPVVLHIFSCPSPLWDVRGTSIAERLLDAMRGRGGTIVGIRPPRPCNAGREEHVGSPSPTRLGKTLLALSVKRRDLFSASRTKGELHRTVLSRGTLANRTE